MRALVLLIVVAGCGGPSFAPSEGPLCVAARASVCLALGGAHECTDGMGHICALCEPAQRDQCPLDGVSSGVITNGDAAKYYVCVDACAECAQDPREKALGITCNADPFADEVDAGAQDLAF